MAVNKVRPFVYSRVGFKRLAVMRTQSEDAVDTKDVNERRWTPWGRSERRVFRSRGKVKQ